MPKKKVSIKPGPMLYPLPVVMVTVGDMEENNIITRNYIDLTNESLIESFYFYVKPDDVIYVEPLKRRGWGMQAFPFGVFISALSTLVIILTYMQLYGSNN